MGIGSLSYMTCKAMSSEYLSVDTPFSISSSVLLQLLHYLHHLEASSDTYAAVQFCFLISLVYASILVIDCFHF